MHTQTSVSEVQNLAELWRAAVEVWTALRKSDGPDHGPGPGERPSSPEESREEGEGWNEWV